MVAHADRATDVECVHPFGTTAELILSGSGERVQLMPGAYSRTLTMPAVHPFGMMSNWHDLVDDARAKAVIETCFPKAIRGIAFQKEQQTMDQVVRSPFATLTRETIAAMREELGKNQE